MIQAQSTDKHYKLLGNKAPISFMLPARNTKRFRLLYYDEGKQINRPLRYAVNQKSPFEDEQDGEAILDAIVFENGFLHVPKTNPVLQAFLHYHPLNGVSFAEVNIEKDASAEVDRLNAELDALVAARGLSLEQMEGLTRVLFGKDPTSIQSAVMRRDLLIYAKQNPKSFLEQVNDPSLSLYSDIRVFFDKKILNFKNQKRDVFFNLRNNKTRMLIVPFGEDPYKATAAYLQTDEGLEILKMLEMATSET